MGEDRHVVRHWWNRRWGSGRMDVHVERAPDGWVVAIREGDAYTARWTYDSEGKATLAAEHLLETAETIWYDITSTYRRSS